MRTLRPIVIVLGFCSCALLGQVAPSSSPVPTSGNATAAPANVNAADTSKDVLMLPSFSVVENQDKGYLAGNSVSGTRISTPIADLPFAISAFTQQFIEDIGSRELFDVVKYSAGVQSGSLEFLAGNTSFMIRGFTQPPEHDGFYESSHGNTYVDTVNVERVEVVKGPASLLYGAISPGGTANYITKRPTNTPFTTVGMTLGSWDFARATIDVNVPIVADKLLFRFNAALENGYQYVQPSDSKTIVLDPTLVWNISPMVSLRISAQSFSRSETPAPFNIPQIQVATPASIVASLYNPGYPGPAAALSNKTSSDYAAGYTSDSSNPGVSYFYPRFPRDGNYPSTGDSRHTMLQSLEVELNVTLNSHWTSRLDFDLNDDLNEYVITGQSQAYLPPPDSLVYTNGKWSVAPAFAALTPAQQLAQELAYAMQINAQQAYFPSAALVTQNGTESPALALRRPLWSAIRTNNHTLQWEAAGNYSFPWGTIKPMVGLFYDQTEIQTVQANNIGTAASPYFRTWDINPLSPTYYVDQNTAFNVASLTNISANNLAYASDQAAYAILNGSFFHDRLYAVGGARYNVSESQTTNHISNTVSKKYKTHYTTPQLGLGYKILPDLLLYASYSQSYFLPNTLYLSSIETVNGIPQSVPTTQSKPTIGEGYEVGLKTNFLEGRISSTLSLYQIVERDLVSSITQSINGLTLTQSVQGAELTSKGIELETTISPTDNWQIFFSAAIDDARNTAEPAGQSYFLGSPPSLFSKTLVNLWTRYSFKTPSLKGLWIGGGGNYASKQLVTTSNVYAYWPSYTLYNAAVGYDWTWHKTKMSARLNIDNLGNTFYVPTAQVLGLPRHYVLSVTARF
jgi:iron complex outermembrane receptor protein